MKWKIGLAATAGALAVALALVLSACGGDGESSGVASLTNTTGQTTTDDGQGSGDNGSDATTEEERERAQLEYARCMRRHGVDFPDPVNGRFEYRGRRADEPKLEDAQRACRHILEDVAPPLNEEQEAELREASLEFARCMREHGIDYPDPQFSEDEGGMTQVLPEGVEDDPKFEEAQKACQPILDAVQPDGSSGQGDGS
jgi:hypothetical protein